METGYTQQNAAYHLLYCSSFVLFDHGRNLYFDHAGSKIHTDPEHDRFRCDDGGIDWFAAFPCGNLQQQYKERI